MQNIVKQLCVFKVLQCKFAKLYQITKGSGSVVVVPLFCVLPIDCGVLCLSLFSCALSSFAIILKRKR